MKYVKLAFQYMFNKRFWKLALLSLIPAVAISFVSSFSSTVNFFIDFFRHDSYSFLAVHDALTDVNWKTLIALIVADIILSGLLAIIIGTMQRHMRTGRFAITNIFKRINENFLPSFVSLTSIFVFIYLYGLFTSMVISASFHITKNAIATFVISLVLMIILFLVLMLLLCLFSMTCPNMVCTGQNLLDSVSVSVRTVRPHIRSLFFAFTLPLILFFAVQTAIVFAKIRALQIIIDSLMMVFISCYYPVIIFVAYYDIFDKDREDLLPENIL